MGVGNSLNFNSIKFLYLYDYPCLMISINLC